MWLWIISLRQSVSVDDKGPITVGKLHTAEENQLGLFLRPQANEFFPNESLVKMVFTVIFCVTWLTHQIRSSPSNSGVLAHNFVDLPKPREQTIY